MKRRLVVRPEDRVDPEAGRQSTDGTVVVASHEQHLRGGKRFASRLELFKNLGRASASRMKKIAKHKEPSGTRRGHEHRQPCQILLGRAFGHGDPLVAKRSRLAQVQVSYEERSRRRQERRPPWREHNIGISGRGICG